MPAHATMWLLKRLVIWLSLQLQLCPRMAIACPPNVKVLYYLSNCAATDVCICVHGTGTVGELHCGANCCFLATYCLYYYYQSSTNTYEKLLRVYGASMAGLRIIHTCAWKTKTAKGLSVSVVQGACTISDRCKGLPHSCCFLRIQRYAIVLLQCPCMICAKFLAVQLHHEHRASSCRTDFAMQSVNLIVRTNRSSSSSNLVKQQHDE